MLRCISAQVQVSGSTYSTILRNLDSDTVYTVSVVPVYAAGEGLRMSENGKTRKHCTHATAAVGNEINCRSTRGR